MRFGYVVLAGALWLAAGPTAAESLRDSPAPLLAEAETASVTSTQIQNVQRLLKLLADRYPNKYGSVDPGTIDGNFGTGTKAAIRNFQQISGSRSDANNSEQLVADILAALAQMSATQSADTPKSQPPASAPSATPSRTAGRVALPSDPPAGTAGVTPSDANATPNGNANAAPADPPKVAAPKPGPTQAAPQSRRVYFVQAASLRSLESAKREWQRIFEDNRAALTGEQVYFERANIGERGVFFRILIGPMNEKDAARTLCAFLKQNDQTCVVTAKDPTGLLKGESFTDAAKPAAGNDATRAPQPSTPGSDKSTAGISTPPAPGQNTASVPTEGGADGKPEATLPGAGAVDPTGGGETPGAATTAPKVEPPSPPAAATHAPNEADGGSGASSGADTGSEPAAAPDRNPAETTAPLAAAPAAPDNSPPPADRAPGTVPPSESEVPSSNIDSAEKPDAAAAAGGVQPASRPSSVLDAGRALMSSLAQELDRVLAALAMIIGAGALVYGWRRRNRRLSLSQMFRSANLAFSRGAAENTGPLGALENDFESDSLQQSRLARDEFLRETLGEASDENAARADDSAMRINSSLKTLLVEEPAQYKSIFLNWIFLAKVGAALNNKEISIEQLSDRINREFDLLQTYFKIHLLELDDRHRIRQELPGLFYCLQLSQMKKRQSSAKYSAA